MTELNAARVELEVPLRVSVERAWEGLVHEIAEWWPREFYVTDSPAFTLEPHVGGRLFEDTGDGTGALWFHVALFSPPSKLALNGHISPPHGGPATSLVTISLESVGEGSVLRISDHLFGVIPDSACLDEGWRQVFEKNLKEYLEK